jgi:hypothetical protein
MVDAAVLLYYKTPFDEFASEFIDVRGVVHLLWKKIERVFSCFGLESGRCSIDLHLFFFFGGYFFEGIFAQWWAGGHDGVVKIKKIGVLISYKRRRSVSGCHLKKVFMSSTLDAGCNFGGADCPLHKLVVGSLHPLKFLLPIWNFLFEIFILLTEVLYDLVFVHRDLIRWIL